MTNRSLYRREGKLVYIKQPEFNELKYTEKLWNDYETMKDSGGVYSFTEDKWPLFYKKMIEPTDGKNFYCLIYEKNGNPVGEVSFHGYDTATKIARFNIKVEASYRKKGYGTEAARLLLEYFFYELGGLMMIDTVSNPEGKVTLSGVGFEVIRKKGTNITYKLTKDNFLSNVVPESRVVGVIVENGVELLSFVPVIDILTLANKIFGKEYFKIKTVSLDKKPIITSSGIKIDVDFTYDEFKKGNVLIIPNGLIIEDKVQYEKLIDFIKLQNNKCELVVGIMNGILMLLQLGLLKDNNIPDNSRLRDEIKTINGKVNFVNKTVVDNGRTILSSSNIVGIDLAMHILKKFLGEEKARAVCKYIT
ncbi:GNAT family N-acetyltransferase [Clostridium fallax]|uniref:Acetyltransferase (GNAT) domain-containing protein n=1 Tax=Clostridium fallax TaxID=1533 RepID=A0A1M4U9Z3_9CLOT|nr:GNAT family N-acetyltransferase [Clostridium fallax]SHE53478.1 Acetyltransferase (GNAT) domain-containing protein [Clostridium fallax]SQB06151.1 GNAT family acetyltransferase [Clostridium fallax]